MHLLTILAFAVIFWRAEGYARWTIVGDGDLVWTLTAACAQPLLIGFAALLAARRSKRLLARHEDEPELALVSYHHILLVLRTTSLLVFAATVFLTRWAELFDFADLSPALQIVGDLVTLTPFILTIVTMWVAVYPLERALRGHDPSWVIEKGKTQERGWRLSTYLDFHVRHYLLVVGVPMSLILFAANLTRGYESQLQEWTGWVWTPDMLLGLVAAIVFLVAPVLLRRIWRTVSLEPGPVRAELEGLCERIGMRCREILVWKSDGVMINAAVMGVFAPMRYVMLSDALLGTMDVRQIEAVFGHEAGHVRHHHIQHFLVFALVGWVIVAGIMELLARWAISLEVPVDYSATTIQVVGVVATVLFWGFGFGWLSRRFERQADLFDTAALLHWMVGAPARAACIPIPGPSGHRRGGSATGAELFASALERVAILNGIPHEERSWRHSSIGSRVRFLTSLAGDPTRVKSFERLLRRVKAVMLALAVVGLTLTVYYWMVTPELAVLQLHPTP